MYAPETTRTIVDSPPFHDSIVVVAANEVHRHGLRAMLAKLPSVAKCKAMSPPTLAAADGHETFDTLILSCSDISREQAVSLAVRAQSLGTNVLLLFDGNQEESLEIAASIPSNGFLTLQDLTAESLEKALTGVRNGEMPMSGGLANHLLTSVRRHAAANRGRNPYLTPREQQALGLLAEGLSNKQIARRLGISQHGVKRLVANVLAKLNCPNRTLAVAVALRDGLV